MRMHLVQMRLVRVWLEPLLARLLCNGPQSSAQMPLQALCQRHLARRLTLLPTRKQQAVLAVC